MATEDKAAEQLQSELEAHIETTFDVFSSRPVLMHLNADSSWLISLPYPKSVEPPRGRCRYNIVIDVWLKGPQVDLFSWFSAQEHAEPSRFQDLNQLNQYLHQAETRVVGSEQPYDGDIWSIDAVVISHEFSDHCHEATLKVLPTTIPVFAPRKAASVVKSWQHFEHIVEISMYVENKKLIHLPEWMTIGRVHTKYDAPIYFHSAIVITFKDCLQPEVEDAVVYTPHGVAAESLLSALEHRPHVRLLALLHGLHDISLAGAQLNLGMENALEIIRSRKVNYWMPTHDEVKIAHGLVASLLKRIAHTLQIAPGSHPVTEVDNFSVAEEAFVPLANGASIVLA